MNVVFWPGYDQLTSDFGNNDEHDSIWSFGADTTVLGFIGHVIAGSVWAIFHILIVLLQAFIFMMLTLVYIGQAHDTH